MREDRELAYNVMKNEFNPALPYDEETGYIECVATTTKARGKGVSTALMQHVKEELPYKRYVLEVTDSNQVALSLYQKLGFREIERKSEIDAEEKGFRRPYLHGMEKAGLQVISI